MNILLGFDCNSSGTVFVGAKVPNSGQVHWILPRSSFLAIEGLLPFLGSFTTKHTLGAFRFIKNYSWGIFHAGSRHTLEGSGCDLAKGVFPVIKRKQPRHMKWFFFFLVSRIQSLLNLFMNICTRLKNLSCIKKTGPTSALISKVCQEHPISQFFPFPNYCKIIIIIIMFLSCQFSRTCQVLQYRSVYVFQ